MKHHMKRQIIVFWVLALLVLNMSGCGSSNSNASEQQSPQKDDSEMVTVLDAHNEEVQIHVNPQKVAILEPTALDTLDAVGMENTGIKQLGLQQKDSGLPDYLDKYMSSDYVNVGDLFEADFDALDLLNPDLIIYGSRFGCHDQNEGESVAKLKELYPKADLLFYQVNGETFSDDIKRNCETLGAIFPGVKDELMRQYAELENGFVKIKNVVSGPETLFLMLGSGTITFYGSDSRYEMVHDEFGFTPSDTETEAKSHLGADVNAEYVLKQNPKIILLLNHDATMGEGDASNVIDDFMDNSMIQNTDAYKNGNIFELEPTIWYTEPGGLSSVKAMIEDLQKCVEKLSAN